MANADDNTTVLPKNKQFLTNPPIDLHDRIDAVSNRLAKLESMIEILRIERVYDLQPQTLAHYGWAMADLMDEARAEFSNLTSLVLHEEGVKHG